MDAVPPRPRTDPARPTRRRTDRERGPRSARTRSPPPAAAGPEAREADRATARTVGADWRSPAPSRTPPQPPGRPSDLTPTRSGTPAAPSCRSQPRRAAPATGSGRDGSPRPTRPAGRTRSPGPAGQPARPVRENGRPSLATLDDTNRPLPISLRRGGERVPSPLRRRSTCSPATLSRPRGAVASAPGPSLPTAGADAGLGRRRARVGSHLTRLRREPDDQRARALSGAGGRTSRSAPRHICSIIVLWRARNYWLV